MIKVPGTAEGIPAIQQLISEGININVTLLFAQDVYERVAEAYIAGLEELAQAGGDVSRIASVASFFISRIDTLVDAELDASSRLPRRRPSRRFCAACRAKSPSPTPSSPTSATRKFSAARVGHALAARGAQTQRVLWASTSTKNPAYRDVFYVEELIGPDTVDTIPPATYRRLPRPRQTARQPAKTMSKPPRNHADPRKRRHLHEGGHRQAHRQTA